MWYCGIDEAGLGPILGPLSAASCSSTLESNELRILLQRIWPLGRFPKGENSKTAEILDSKKIYRGKAGRSGNFARLEELALSLYFLGHPNFYGLQQEFLAGEMAAQRLFSVEEWQQVQELDWYCNLPTVPVLGDRFSIWQQAKNLNLSLQNHRFLLRGALFSERKYNQKIMQYDNKSIVLRELIGYLLQDFVSRLATGGREQEGQEGHLRGECVVDRLGGLKFYQPWLSKLFGLAGLWKEKRESLRIICEKKEKSEYHLQKEGGTELRLGFWVAGDRQNMLCAVASVWAKYRRELLMLQLNRFWQQQATVPQTSGYYTDGVVFLEELAKQLGDLPLDLRRSR